MRRTIAFGACMGLLLAGLLSAKADDKSDQSGGSLVGKRVIAIRPDVVLRFEPADNAMSADFTPSCNPLEIEAEQGEWLGSTRYWIRRADVVPLAEALEYFTREIEQSPTAYAYVARSRVRRVEKHDLEQALADAEAAIRLDPKFARAWMSRGECRKEQKRYPEAIADFTRALELDAQLLSALYMRGHARVDAGDHEGAIADTTAGLKRWPQVDGWRRLRAMTYSNRGILLCANRPDLAEQDFTSAVEDLLSEQRELAAPDGANRPATSADQALVAFVDRLLAFIYSLRANSRLQLRKLDAAVSDCTQAIGLRPDYATAYDSRGKALVELGDLEGAMKDYNRALELDPRSELAHLNRAELFRQMGEVQNAIDDYTAAIASDPDSLLPHYLRGSYFASLGRHREALEDFTRCVALDPTDADSYMNRAEVWCELHEFAKAIEDLTMVIRIEPHNSLAYRQRAEIWQAAGNKEDAARDLAEAERLEATQDAEAKKKAVR